MSIQIISDLHLESPKAYDQLDIVPKAPILALLGDIGNVVPHKTDLFAFFRRHLERFRVILFVAGNHEAYGSTWPKTLGLLRTFEKEVNDDDSLGNFYLLKRGIFRVPDSDYVVLGCSLFSHVPAESADDVSVGLNDFFQIQQWDIKAHNEAHQRDLAWLNSQVDALEKEDIRMIIFTHWCPTADERALDPKNKDSPISSGFATDLSGEVCFKSDKVKLWAFGHTHYNCDFEMERPDGAGSLRLLANQRGYFFSQAAGYDEGKIVDL